MGIVHPLTYVNVYHCAPRKTSSACIVSIYIGLLWRLAGRKLDKET